MLTRTCRRAWLLALCIFLTPTFARGQNYEVPPPSTLLPIPLGGPRYEQGGFFFAGEFLFMRQTNPIDRQDIAFRGFMDLDGSISGVPGSYVGSGSTALSTDAVSAPITYQPGLSLTAGWRFRDGTVVEAMWWHLSDARYSATASILPPGFNVAANLSETVITSPVFGYALQFAGPANDVAIGNPGATFGIWNASDRQTIDFVQRFDMGGIHLRVPIHQTESLRTYGIVGGRAIIMWERFRWLVYDRDVNGVQRPVDVAQYSNVVSNRLYGAWVGCGCDWYWGSTPLGAFSATLDLQGSVMVDIVKERAKYELPDALLIPTITAVASRARNEYKIAPVVQFDASMWWYPYEGIQCRVGWDILAMFNTVASPNPVDFNVGALAPAWEDGITRVLRGFHVGVGFMF